MKIDFFKNDFFYYSFRLLRLSMTFNETLIIITETHCLAIATNSEICCGYFFRLSRRAVIFEGLPSKTPKMIEYYVQIICEFHRYQCDDHRAESVTVHGLDEADRRAILAAFGNCLKRDRTLQKLEICLNGVDHMQVSLTI